MSEMVTEITKNPVPCSSSPVASVLMCVYKEPMKYLVESTESVLRQTYKDFEFIVVVDNPENLEAINYIKNLQQKDPRIRLLVNEINIGFALSLNKGIEIVKGQYIMRMDADDICEENRLERELEEIKRTGADLVFSAYQKIDENSMPFGRSKFIPNSAIKKLLKISATIHHPAVLFRTDSIRELGGYRAFETAQDYDLWLRMMDNGCSFYYISEHLLRFRLHTASVSATKRFKQELCARYALSLHRERIKNEKKDSFSPEHMNEFLVLNGNGNQKKINKVNKDALLYSESIKRIKSGNVTSWLTIIRLSLTNTVIRKVLVRSIRWNFVCMSYTLLENT